MAIEKVIKIDVDQVKAMGGLEAFKQSLTQTEEKSQSLKAELAQLKKQLASLDEGSEQYQTIAKRAGEVSDKIGDISKTVKNLGSDTKYIDTVIQGAQTLSGAFSVASSASALLGTENEDLQKAMLKVESAIGLVVGVQSIANALQKESALAIGVASVATKIQMGLQVAYTAVVGTTTGALKALRLALISTGVGALVVALGYLISKMSESTEATEEQKEAQDRLNESLERSNKLFQEEASGINDVTKVRILRAKIAGKSEKDLSKIENEAHEERLSNIKAEQTRLYALLDDKNINLETSKKINDALAKNNKAFIDELNSDDERRLTNQLEIADKQRENEKKLSEEAKRRADERRKELEEQRKKDLEELKNALQKQKDAELQSKLDTQSSIDKATEENIAKGLSDKDNELRAVNDKYFSLFELAKQNGQDTTQLEIAKLNELNDINLKYQQIDYDNKKKKADDEIAIEKATAEAKLAIQNAQLDNVSNGISLLQNLGIKNKAIQKGLLIAENAAGIARIIINTMSANAKAIAASPLTAGQPFVTANTISGAIGIASSIAATAKGLSALGGGSSSGASMPSGGGGGSESTPPSFNIVGQNPNNQLAQSIAQQQNQPLQAYVVSGNVTSAQSLDRNKIDTATFN